MYILSQCLALCLCFVQSVDAQPREAIPAIVNPALRSTLRQTISLDGSWNFAMDPHNQGDKEKWFSPEVALPNKIDIQVPGSWESQYVGGVGVSVSVTPEQVNRPLSGSYVGTGWYKKEVVLPGHWSDKEIWLKIGGVHAQGWIWVNGTFLNHDACYCGTYKYRITDLINPADRKVIVVVKTRNDVPSGKGLFGWLHRFGGLYRSVEIDATPPILVDYAYVEGDLDRKSAAVNVKIRSTKSTNASAEVQVQISTLDGIVAGRATKSISLDSSQTQDVVLNASLNPFYSWSPEHPGLYRADITLRVNGREIDGWVERFGVRKWEKRNGNFYLNNQKYFVRGYGDDWVYPWTICSPASKDYHKEHLKLARSFGFNYVRHHTHCEIPEFYEAADEMGIMVQPELPYYGSRPSAGAEGWFRPKEDLKELVTHYRRYVSLSTYCTGNEGHLGSPIDKEIYALAKQLDPTRLFLHQDGGQSTPDNSDFRTGPVSIWAPGTMDDSMPFFAHEYMNLAIDRDPRTAWKYFGAQMPPLPAQRFLKELQESCLSVKWGEDILDSGRYLQRLWQKEGLESARLDPVCDGYIYWTMMDVDFFSDQGLLDQFWHVKKTTPLYFREFNRPTALLAAHENRPIGAEQRILAEGDELKVDWWISHFNETPLSNADFTWILQSSNDILGSGSIKNIKANVGDVKYIGSTSYKIPNIKKPVNAKLTATLEGTDILNSWEIWMFPRIQIDRDFVKGLASTENVYKALIDQYPGLTKLDKSITNAPDIILTDRLDGSTLEALEKGKAVILLRLFGPTPGFKLGWWGINAQTGTAIADHLAFGDFPHDGYLNHLFFRLINSSIKCSDDEFKEVEKIMVGHGNQGYLAHVFQAKAGNGRLLASGLNLLTDNPESIYLLHQFIQYVRSPYFNPQGYIDLATAQNKWKEAAELLDNLNGWSETVKQFHHASSYASFLGSLPMDVARFSSGETEVAWLTQTVPVDIDTNKPYAFKWIAALGWITEPEAQFDLYLNDKKLLSFGVTDKDRLWKNESGQIILKYKSMDTILIDSSGVMTLTLPGKMLNLGQKSLLRVVAPQTGSKRWFGLYRYRYP